MNSGLLKRLDGLANDFKSRAMFNSEAAVIEAEDRIRELESLGTYAEGIEAAKKVCRDYKTLAKQRRWVPPAILIAEHILTNLSKLKYKKE